MIEIIAGGGAVAGLANFRVGERLHGLGFQETLELLIVGAEQRTHGRHGSSPYLMGGREGNSFRNRISDPTCG